MLIPVSCATRAEMRSLSYWLKRPPLAMLTSIMFAVSALSASALAGGVKFVEAAGGICVSCGPMFVAPLGWTPSDVLDSGCCVGVGAGPDGISAWGEPDAGACSIGAAVSYTHLTLPTI